MSVLIKGMNIPSMCAMCPLAHRVFDGSETRLACYATAKWISDDGEVRPEFCPLEDYKPCGDTISRRSAIDALEEQMPKPYTPDGSHPADEGIFAAQEIYADCIQTLEALPSAQPEIIRCKDCKRIKKWRSEESAKKFGQIYECVRNVFDCPKPEDFCSRAERRTDG